MANPEPLLVSDALLSTAEQRCRARLLNDPENAALLEQLGEVLRKMGRLDEAAVAYARLALLRPGDESVLYRHALIAGFDPTPLPPPGLQPAPFVFLKNFLPESLHSRLVPYTISTETQLRSANMNDEYPESREMLELRTFDLKREVGAYIRRTLETMRERLHVAPFETGQMEVKLRVYRDGDFFRLHMDNPANSENCNRRISYVYFYHRVPRAYTGGDLLLFDTDLAANEYTVERFTKIQPQDNCIVFFQSGCYHSVLPVCCPTKQIADSRFVISGHVHSKAAAPKSEAETPTPAVAAVASESR